MMLVSTEQQPNMYGMEGPSVQQAAQMCYEYYKNEFRADGTTRYEHAQRIIDEILIPTLGGNLVTDGMRMAAYFHDRITPFYEASPKSIEKQTQLKYEVDFLRMMEPEVTEYALAIATSAQYYELAAEKWRESAREAIYDKTSYPFIQDQIESIALFSEKGTTTAQLSDRLSKSITDGKNSIDQDILKWRPPLGDINLMVETLQTWDIEGLVLKSAEVIDNLRHPNPNRPASAWRDAQELLSFYAPLLDITGFSKLSSLAYSEANRYINVDPDTNKYVDPTPEQLARSQKAKILNNMGDNFINLPLVMEGDTSQQTYTYDSVMRNIMLNIFGQNSEIQHRTKSVGSIIEKTTHPDLVGYRIIVDDLDSFETQIHDLIAQISSLPGIKAKHTRPSAPVVEISLDRTSRDKITQNEIDQIEETIGVPCKIGGKRGFRQNYEAIHISFTFQDLAQLLPEEDLAALDIPEIGIEIQLMDREMYKKAQRGEASHILYKSTGALGEFGIQTRDLHGETEGKAVELYNFVVAHLIEKFEMAYQRAEVYRNYGDTYLISRAAADELANVFKIGVNKGQLTTTLLG